MPCLARLGDRDTPLPASKIEVLPLGIQQFTLAASHQQEQRHDVLELGVLSLSLSNRFDSGCLDDVSASGRRIAGERNIQRIGTGTADKIVTRIQRGACGQVANDRAVECIGISATSE